MSINNTLITDSVGHTPIINIIEHGIENCNLYAKLESYNPTGSVKDRAADYVLFTLLNNGIINAQTKIIESSSGNFAIALAVFCKKYKLDFWCVIDPNINSENERILEYLNVNIIKVAERDKYGGFLLTRIKVVQAFMKENDNSYWINQYGNPHIVDAYYHTLGNEICNEGRKYDYVFMGVSSGGTISGVSKRIKETYPDTKIIAVDIKGSVIFGGKALKRHIPGIGSSMVPDNLKHAKIDGIVMVTEEETVKECQELLRSNCILAGGSSGSVIVAVKKYFAERTLESENQNVLVIFPDRGDRYCSTIYNKEWCKMTFTKTKE